VRTVAQLAHSEVTTIQRAVGKVAGAHLHDLAWGRDPRPVEPGRVEKSVGAEVTFPADVHDVAVVQTQALTLADRCAERLRAESLLARTVSIKVRTSDFRTLTRSRTLTTPTDVGREIFLVARELLAAVDLGGLPVRLVGVRAEGLSPAETTPRQPTLEEATAEEHLARRDAERVMDLVRGRFGRAAIAPGSVAGNRDSVTPPSTTVRASGDLS
jgi:DNA polymerase-4